MPEVSQVISSDRHWFINNGSPHHIEFVEDTAPIDVLAEGRKVRYNDRYKAEGTNVNYVQIVDTSILKVRTYERGVEQETLSCGTGVVASSLAASFLDVASPVKVITEGGELEVGFEKDGDIFTKVYLKGGVEQIFEGTFDHE